MTFRLGLVSRDEIADHKANYDKDSLNRILKLTGFKLKIHRYFQAGMNNFCVAER